MNNLLLGILIFLSVVNLFAFIIMYVDKRKARSGSERISEATLFFLAAFFGGVGVYLGMFLFRHKTRKWYFYLGIPLIVVQNLGFLYLFYEFLKRINIY